MAVGKILSIIKQQAIGFFPFRGEDRDSEAISVTNRLITREKITLCKDFFSSAAGRLFHSELQLQWSRC